MWRARRNCRAMREMLRRFSQLTASSGVGGAGRVDRLRRSRGFDHGARLHFYKRERLAVVTNHVNFAFDAGRSEIARNENVAVAP